ncbi:hypothetical protein K2173_027186 [Erythroxylum novogranatense]|uniref:Wall-associated receptor kinase galacturonan-binding domain-containing protein n=1 Tax=Erythroxylum novogranatense TaxID=1862640 RepID=A0AAV8U160_9ROSI|nr:hypothetical protein K2173_027186 [Erythroxylum novogranatense]
MLLVVTVCALTLATTQVSSFGVCPQCGRVAVPYPLSTGDNCGDPRYRIYCNNDTLEFLSAQGFYYKILTINPRTNSLVISPPLIQEHTCYSSDLGLGGLNLDENLPFNISTRNTVMLFNCSDSILLSPLNCSSTSLCRQFEEIDAARGCRDTLCCQYLKDSSMTSHRIRIGGCTAYTSLVDVRPGDPIDAWNYGIELKWFPPTEPAPES